MFKESELKFLAVNFDELRSSLSEVGIAFKYKQLEINYIFDTADCIYKQKGILFRLRHAHLTHRLNYFFTLKTPYADKIDIGSNDIKIVNEFETKVDNPVVIEKSLQNLGLDVVLTYHKFREVWQGQGIDFCLDIVPLAGELNYILEIEGQREEIFSYAVKLNLDLKQSSKKSYHTLNADRRKQLGLPPDSDFIFNEELFAVFKNVLKS